MRVRGLRKAFGGQVVLDGIDLDLHEGQVVLLRGPNGSGKTTLLNILTGNLEPDAGNIEIFTNGVPESFRFPRHWWQNLNPMDHFLPERVARERVGRSWQETRLFPSLNLHDNIAVARPGAPGINPLNLLFRPGRVREAERAGDTEAQRLLVALGLGDRGASSADKVSLGQTKRVAIARAVHAGAKILLLDEPLAGLDAAGIRSVLEMLTQLVTERRLTIVIVEHVWNAGHVLPLANTLWTLDRGKLTVACNGVDGDCRDRTASESRDIASLFPGFTRVETRELPKGAQLDVYRRTPDPTAEVVLDVQDLVVRRGRRLVIGEQDATDAVLSGLSLRLRAGDLAILQAPNGWGKTSLLEALAGTVQSQARAVEIAGRRIGHLRDWQRRRSGLCLIQSQGTVFPSLTVAQARRIIKDGPGDGPQWVSASRDNEFCGSLSGGQQRALSFEGIVDDVPVLLLDEPFGGLADPLICCLTDRLSARAAKGLATLVAIPCAGGHDNAGPL